MRDTQDVPAGSLSEAGTVSVTTSGGKQPAAAPEITPLSPGPPLTSSFSFFLSLSVSEFLRKKNSRSFFSLFLETLSRMSWHLIKGRRALTFKKKKKKKAPSFPELFHKGPECSYSEVLHFCRGCFMVPRLSHGNVPERGRWGEEMPFWIKETKKKWICRAGICVTHPGYTQIILWGGFFLSF